jgi:drug/metabolite transporter (DMT)-like permease
MWLIFSILGYAILAVVAMMDKYLLSSAKVQPALYTFYSTIFVLPVLFLLPFGVGYLSSWADWLLALLSGLTFALALWTMFLGFEKSEISHVGPLIGAATPLFVLLFSNLFLSEILSFRQLIACGFLIIGSLIVSFEKSKQHIGWHSGIAWGILSGLLYGASHVSAKYIYDRYGFLDGFVWTRAAIALLGIFLLFHPAIYRTLFFPSIWQRIKNKFSRVSAPQDNIVLVGIDKILSVVGVVIIQYAIAVGSVSLVNALNGLQYAFLIILVLIFSKFWPKKFKENYSSGEIFQELIAVIIIIGGLILLV